MLEEKLMDKIVYKVEKKNKYRFIYLERILKPKGKEIVESLNISEDEDIYDEVLSFTNDYIDLYSKKQKELNLANKLTDNDKINYSRIFFNTAIYGGLANIITSDPMFSAGAAGFGLGLTSYDEIKDNSSFDMGGIAFFGIVGGLVGSFIGDNESGKYIGAGIGAICSTFKYLENNKNLEDFISNTSRSKYIKKIVINHDQKKDELKNLYR